MELEAKVALLPCPFCCNDKIYAGRADGSSVEVACRSRKPRRGQIKGCGARVRLEVPSQWTPAVPYSPRDPDGSLQRLAQHTLDEVVRRWNTRQAGPEVPRKES